MSLREQMKNMDYDKTDFLLYNLRSGNRETIKKFLKAIDYDQPTNEITVQCLPVCVAHVLRRILPTADQSYFFAGNTEKIEKALEIFDSHDMCRRLDILYDMVLPVIEVHLPNIDAQAELTLVFANDYFLQILKELDSIECVEGLEFPVTGGMLYEPPAFDINKYIACIDPASDNPDITIMKRSIDVCGNPTHIDIRADAEHGNAEVLLKREERLALSDIATEKEKESWIYSCVTGLPVERFTPDPKLANSYYEKGNDISAHFCKMKFIIKTDEKTTGNQSSL